jgi:hypothetical protein
MAGRQAARTAPRTGLATAAALLAAATLGTAAPSSARASINGVRMAVLLAGCDNRPAEPAWPTAAARCRSRSPRGTTVAAGGFAGYAVTRSGQVLAWGGSSSGELGQPLPA